MTYHYYYITFFKNLVIYNYSLSHIKSSHSRKLYINIHIIKQYLKKVVNNSMHPKYSALFTSVNLLLGVGPLILPMPFFNAGVLLSVIWMIIICLLSYNSAMFISQSMSKLHQISYDNRESALGLTDSLVTSQEQDMTAEQVNKKSENVQQQKNLQLDHTDQFQLLFSKKWGLFPSITISIYLLGTSVSKCIMTGKIMSKVFDHLDENNFLRNFNFWIFIFFISGAAFSFRSIDKTKVMQVIIIGVRILSIILFLFGALFLICRDGVKKMYPSQGIFNPSNFVSLFSNSVFALMFHHSFPNIVNSLKNTEDVTFVIRYAFLISGGVLMLIPITGLMAFGADLTGKGDDLIYYNFDYEDKINLVFWVTSFYVFLNVAAFSVYIIVIRTNVLHMINPKINAKKLSIPTAISSTIILAIILLLSWQLQNKIQIVLDFTGGIFGIFILFLMPCIEVYRARKKIHKPGNPYNYIRWLPIFIAVLGLLFMGFNLYHIIDKLTHPKTTQFSLVL